jgi:hypothetical protein
MSVTLLGLALGPTPADTVFLSLQDMTLGLETNILYGIAMQDVPRPAPAQT